MERLLSSGIEAEQVEPVDELEDLRAELAELREDFTKFRAAIERDRNQLGGILQGIRSVFGGGGAAPSSAPSMPAEGGAPQPPNDAAWQMWKQRLPGGCGRIIDALLIQPLTMTQMIRACGMAYGTVKNNVAILRNNGLVDRDGEKLKLKRL